jgi:2-keto-4-pentenoate hydratase/2-oxohepta-3-ene-1,7-dioic acid hydratase in catechol pathway
MKWCRFGRNGAEAYGLVEGDQVAELRYAPFEHVERTGKVFALDTLSLLPPVMPYNFYAAGRNYVAHVEWANEYHHMSIQVPRQADIGYRAPSALIGSGDEIVIPRRSNGAVEYEGELVAVVGKKAKHLTVENALSCICGYTLGNDLSERAFQKSDGSFWRSKNTDTFKPMGPFVVSDLDPMSQMIGVRVNGRVVSEYHTSGMVFSIAHYIARMTEFLTLYPGDVIWMGCDGATVPALQPGDLVEVFNDEIGVLSNRVVKET